MQGSNESSMELLDAGVVVGHLIPPGSVYEFLGESRRRLFTGANIGKVMVRL